MKEKLHRIKANSKAVRDLLKKWKKVKKLKDRCLVCGERMKITFHTHHIDGNPKNNSPSNIAKICGSCHSITWKAKTPDDARRFFIERHRMVTARWRSEAAREAWRRKRESGAVWWSKTEGIRIRRKSH